jgi:mono/diheme cytochrome c family protein
MPATSLSHRTALSLLASLSACVADERTFLATVAYAPHYTSLDTLPPQTYEGWKQYQLVCARCHGEEAQGSSFGPSLLAALKPDGSIPT